MNELKEAKVYVLKQSALTSDCWLVQIQGLEACDHCEVRDTDECGGGESLKALLTMEEK